MMLYKSPKVAIMHQMIAYIRVSTSQQGRSGLGIEAQREAIALCRCTGGGDRFEYVEVETGKGADALTGGPS